MEKVLICLMFKNSSPWISNFMDCIKSLLSNRPEDISYSISTIYSDSADGTTEALKEITSKLKTELTTDISITRINLPDRLDGIQKLVILRNSFLQINDLSKYDYMLVADTDVLFDYGIILKLIKHMNNPKLNSCGIVAPMIFIDNYKTHNNGYFYDTFAYRIEDRMFLHKKPYVPIELDRNKHKWTIEVDSVGSLYLIRTDIFSKYNIYYDTYIRKNTKDHPQRLYESEQVVMCKNVKENTPYKIYVDLSSKVYHINLELYGLKWH